MLIVGIDPGTTGAAIALDPDALRVADVFDLQVVKSGKTTWLDGAMLADWLDKWRPDLAILEHVHYWSQDKHPDKTSYMVRLSGGIEAVLSCLNIPFLHVQPHVWKRRAGLMGKDKSASLALAKARLSWPADTLRLAKHEHRAEAALVALYGRAPAAPPKPPRRNKIVDQLAAENVPPGSLFGGS